MTNLKIYIVVQDNDEFLTNQSTEEIELASSRNRNVSRLTMVSRKYQRSRGAQCALWQRRWLCKEEGYSRRLHGTPLKLLPPSPCHRRGD